MGCARDDEGVLGARDAGGGGLWGVAGGAGKGGGWGCHRGYRVSPGVMGWGSRGVLGAVRGARGANGEFGWVAMGVRGGGEGGPAGTWGAKGRRSPGIPPSITR